MTRVRCTLTFYPANWNFPSSLRLSSETWQSVRSTSSGARVSVGYQFLFFLSPIWWKTCIYVWPFQSNLYHLSCEAIINTPTLNPACIQKPPTGASHVISCTNNHIFSHPLIWWSVFCIHVCVKCQNQAELSGSLLITVIGRRRWWQRCMCSQHRCVLGF